MTRPWWWIVNPWRWALNRERAYTEALDCLRETSIRLTAAETVMREQGVSRERVRQILARFEAAGRRRS